MVAVAVALVVAAARIRALEAERLPAPAVPAGALRLTVRTAGGETLHLVVRPGSAVALPGDAELVGVSVVLDYAEG